jgi:hypothetical protein
MRPVRLVRWWFIFRDREPLQGVYQVVARTRALSQTASLGRARLRLCVYAGTR